MQRGQISFEYLVILGFAMLLILGAVAVFTSYSATSSAEVVGSQVERIGRDISHAATKVHSIGDNTWITLDVNIPDEVEGMMILNKEELVIRYAGSEGANEAVFFFDVPIWSPFKEGSNYNVSDAFHTGRMLIRVRSFGTNVSIFEYVP